TSSAKLRAWSLLSALFRSRIRSLDLALLGNFRLRWSSRDHRIHGWRHFFLDRHHVSYSCTLVGNEFEVAVRQIGHPDRTVQSQAGDIQVNMARDIARQALDLNLAQHLVENAALHFDSDWDSLQQDRHTDAYRLVHGDALEVDVHELALDG